MSFEKNIAFETTHTVTSDSFFGRVEQLRQCEQRVGHHQSTLITGESRIGKTSLLAELTLRAKTHFGQSIILSAEGWDPASVLDSLIKQLGSSPKKTGNARVFADLATQSDRPIVAFFNDFDTVLRQSVESEFGFMLKSLVDAGHSAFCAVAQRHGFLDSNNRLIPFPLVSYFQELPLRGFAFQEARELLTTLSRRSGDELLEQECDLVIDLIGTVPHRLQTFGFELFSHADFVGSIDGERLHLITRTIETVSDGYRDSFSHRIAYDPIMDEEHWIRLVSIAHGESPMDDPETHYLRKRGFLASDDTPFLFQGTLFRDFLRTVPKTTDGRSTVRERLAKAGGIAIDAAIKAAVASVFH